MQEFLTKKAFAGMTGVTQSCVSHWIGEKKLHGPALVGRGCRARVRVSVALEQLRKNLDIDQRLGANAKARLVGQKPAASSIPPSLPEAAGGATEAQGDAEPDTLEDRIKTQRLAQLALGNAKASEEAAARSAATSRAMMRGRRWAGSPRGS